MTTANDKCLYCCEPLSAPSQLYHPACCRKFFLIPQPPTLQYSYDDISELAKQNIMNRVTITGVQAKLSLHLEKVLHSNRLTIVGLWGNFILKPPVAAYPFLPEIEHATMFLAKSMNIATVPFALIPMDSGELCFITRRIDRHKNGQKIHMEDMCQLTERLTEDKYKGSIERVGKVIKTYSTSAGLDCINLFERVLFCFITGNADMHLKNFSLLYQPVNRILLSPAYDLVATKLIIPEKDDPEETALTINGKRSKLCKTDFDALGTNLGINQKQLSNVYKSFSSKLPSMIQLVDTTFMPADLKTKFRDLLIKNAGLLEL